MQSRLRQITTGITQELRWGRGGGEGAAVTQREGMGLLEYQAMPSLRELAHDGCLCTYLLYNSSWKFHPLAAGQLLSGQPVRYWKERRYGPYKITCCHFPRTHAGGIRNKLCKDDFTLVSQFLQCAALLPKELHPDSDAFMLAQGKCIFPIGLQN